MNAQPVTSHETGVRPTLLALQEARHNLNRARQSYELAIARCWPVGLCITIRDPRGHFSIPTPACVVAHRGELIDVRLAGDERRTITVREIVS